MNTKNWDQQSEIYIYIFFFIIIRYLCAEIACFHHRSLVTNQDDLDKRLEGIYEDAYKSKQWDFPFKDTVMNIYRARHSCELSWEIMAEYASSQGITYDAVAAVRLDVAFLSDIIIPKLHSIEKGTVYVPHFHSNGGINDRFAFGEMEAMRVYMNRYDPIAPIVKKVQY